MIEIDWNPDPRTLRRWAVSTAAGLGLAGTLFAFVDWGPFRAGRGLPPYLWGFAIISLLTAGTGTRIGLPAYWIWSCFTKAVGTVLGVTALAAVYFLVVTPLAIAGRWAGRDRLDLRRDAAGAAAASAWHPLPERPHDPARQF